MKFKIIILLCILLIIFTNLTFAYNSDDVPAMLRPAELQIKMANSIFDYHHSQFEEDVNQILRNTGNDISVAGHSLLGLFLIASMLAKYQEFNRLNLYTMIPPLAFYGIGHTIIELERRHNLIIRLARTLNEQVMMGLTHLDSYGGFIPFEVILEAYNETSATTSGMTGVIADVFNAGIFFVVGLVGVIASVIILAYIIIREIKLGIYSIISPVMISGFGSPYTARFSKNFVKKVIMTGLELFYIYATIGVFVGLLGSSGGDAFTRILMLVIIVVGIAISIIMGPQLVFGFMMSR